MPNILIIYAHAAPHHSRVNQRMMEAAAELPFVTVRDLYELYPDFHIDVAQEQAALAAADLIVVQHPLQWYSTPALLKEWFDVVLESGWAYGTEGTALRGKDYWLTVTTGGPPESYLPEGAHGLPLIDFLQPQRQTALLCGMRWWPPGVLHAAHQVDNAAVDQHIADFVTRLRGYPEWPMTTTESDGTRIA